MLGNGGTLAIVAATVAEIPPALMAMCSMLVYSTVCYRHIVYDEDVGFERACRIIAVASNNSFNTQNRDIDLPEV